MEDIYRLNLNPLLSCPDEGVVRNGNVDNVASELHLGLMANNLHNHNHNHNHNHMEEDPEPDRLIKNQIASHPLYPNLLSAYIECQKVGAPTEVASLLEEIGRDSESHPRDALRQNIGDDPELDDFMESYCQVLHRYKQELSKPFNEATLFLSDIESQLSNLCNGTLTISQHNNNNNNNRSDEATGRSEEELSCEKVEGCGTCAGDEELKEMLLRKYGGYLSSLRKEFLKKRKKGKLPKDARKALMDWWSVHYRWPYPTEEEKLQLSEMTGLDINQINNWFINQRKRHWKPSEDMRFAIMEGVSGTTIAGGGPM